MQSTNKIPIHCPFCNTNMTVNIEHDVAVCSSCEKPFIIKDAIVKCYIEQFTDSNTDTNATKLIIQKNFEIKGGTLEKYNGESVDVIIPNNVIKIGYKAFMNSSIRSVVIPNSVKEIQGFSFCNCSELTDINIPNSVKTIGESAFSGCCGLTQIKIPDSVERIHGRAFEGCNSATVISIPLNTIINQDSFENVSNGPTWRHKWHTENETTPIDKHYYQMALEYGDYLVFYKNTCRKCGGTITTPIFSSKKVCKSCGTKY